MENNNCKNQILSEETIDVQKQYTEIMKCLLSEPELFYFENRIEYIYHLTEVVYKHYELQKVPCKITIGGDVELEKQINSKRLLELISLFGAIREGYI